MLNNIDNIFINFEDGKNLSIPIEYIKKFYISNINKDGDEVPYEETKIKEKMIANFAMILFNENTFNQNEFRLLKNNNIYSISLKFKNKKTITFILASANSPFLDNKHNEYQKEYIFNNIHALLISEYKIKYITSLFI